MCQPPCAKPPDVSSSVPPGACTTPSRLMNSFTITLRISVSFGSLDRSDGSDGPATGKSSVAAERPTTNSNDVAVPARGVAHLLPPGGQPPSAPSHSLGRRHTSILKHTSGGDGRPPPPPGAGCTTSPTGGAVSRPSE